MAHEIALTVADHKVTAATGHVPLVAGCVEHYTVTATFDEEWDALTKYVTFRNDKADAPTGPLAYEDGVTVPAEQLVGNGALRVTFKGVAADQVETAVTAHMRHGIHVYPAGETVGEGKAEATPDVVDEAARVNATLSGTTITVTSRDGSTASSDLKGDKGDTGTTFEVDVADGVLNIAKTA